MENLFKKDISYIEKEFRECGDMDEQIILLSKEFSTFCKLFAQQLQMPAAQIKFWDNKINDDDFINSRNQENFKKLIVAFKKFDKTNKYADDFNVVEAKLTEFADATFVEDDDEIVEQHMYDLNSVYDIASKINFASTTSKPKLKVVKEKTVQAAKKVATDVSKASLRTTVTQVFLTLKIPTLIALKPQIDKIPNEFVKVALNSVLDSSMGDAIIKYSIGTVLPAIKPDNKIIEAISEELCIQGMQYFTDELGQIIFAPIKSALTEMLISKEMIKSLETVAKSLELPEHNNVVVFEDEKKEKAKAKAK